MRDKFEVSIVGLFAYDAEELYLIGDLKRKEPLLFWHAPGNSYDTLPPPYTIKNANITNLILD